MQPERTVDVTQCPKTPFKLGNQQIGADDIVSKTTKKMEPKMRFRPLHDRVLLERLEEDHRTPGGVIVPDTAKEKPVEARVIAVGPGAIGKGKNILPMSVKVGDRVVLGKWSGTEVKIDDKEYVILKEGEILGVIDEAQISSQAA
jgi:chaperonin GroES